MMVVVLLSGLALAVAVPSLPRTDAGSSPGAHPVVRSLHLARRTAAVRGQPVTVRFRLEQGIVETLVPGGDPGEDHLLSRDRLVGELEVRPPTADPSLRIGPLGRAAGPRLIVRGDRSGREIGVDPWTGEVEVTVVD